MCRFAHVTPAASSSIDESAPDWVLEDFANEKVPPPESANSVDKWVEQMARRISTRLGPRSEEQQLQDSARLQFLGQQLLGPGGSGSSDFKASTQPTPNFSIVLQAERHPKAQGRFG